MSTKRSRPTRTATQRRIREAAAEVFTEVGVPAATVDQIVERAGYTRGAFYSNFADKAELAVAMLDAHLERSREANRRLLAEHPEPDRFVAALRERGDDRDDDPLHEHPLLQVELMLYAAGTPELRPRLGQHLTTMRALVGEIAAETIGRSGQPLPAPPEELGTVLVALEDGLRLHRLIDPDSTPADAFVQALDLLRRLIAEE